MSSRRNQSGARSKKWVVLCVALLAVLALFASACGGSDASDSASGGDETTSAAAEATEAEPTSPPEPTAEPEPTTEPEPTASAEPEPTATPEPAAEPEPAGLGDPGAWQDCGDGFECAAFDVPLDYEAPDGEQFTLNITRSPARVDAARIGTVFVNPGGPGSGARSLVDQYSSGPLNDVFDVVGIDNRGTGGSSAIACNDNFTEDLNQEYDETDGWDDEIQAFLDDFEVMAQACEERYGSAVLASLTTENAARDLEAIRIALGDEPLNYLGVSYGTMFGSVYAAMFPDNIRTLVLDSAISPSNVHGVVDRAVDYELQYARLDRSCELSPDCPMHEVGYIAGFEQLIEELQSGELTGATVADAAIIWALVPAAPADIFEVSAAIFDLALDGETGPLAQIGGQVTESLLEDLAGGSNVAITCADGDRWSSATLEELPGLVERSEEEAPMMAPNVPIPCELWPVQGDGNPAINYTGDAPILVINNTGDALTPLRFAEVLVDELGPKATLVVNDSTGHGAFGVGQCVTRLTMAYLVDLTVPEPGTTCELEGTFGLTMDESGVLAIDEAAAPVESALVPGDRIISVDGTPLREMSAPPLLLVGQPLTVEIEREGEVMTLDVTPAYTSAELWRSDG